VVLSTFQQQRQVFDGIGFKKKLTEELNHLPGQEELGDGRNKLSLF